jgi:hypothetical protein
MNIDHLLREHAPDVATLRTETERLRTAVLADAIADSDRSYDAVRPRIRRPRTLLRVAVAAAALAVVATGVSLTLEGGRPASAAQQRFVGAAPAPAYETYGAFSSGSTVYIGNHQVTFDEKIKSLYYTSEGVLVRTGRVAYLDDSGASHYELIRPDGSHTGIDLRMGDRVVATDPQSPNVAYLEPTGDRWSFVVIDLVTGSEVARKTVGGAFTWGGWEAPPVTMAGTRVWGLFDAGWVEYDWKTDATRTIPGTEGASLDAAHGRFALYNDVDRRDWEIKDFLTSDTVRTIPSRDIRNGGSFSPDGRFVRLSGSWGAYDGDSGKLVERPGPSRFLSIATGEIVSIPGRHFYGWTPGGNTLSVDAKNDRLTVCSPSTGKCDRIDLPISGNGKVKLGGTSYES